MRMIPATTASFGGEQGRIPRSEEVKLQSDLSTEAVGGLEFSGSSEPESRECPGASRACQSETLPAVSDEAHAANGHGAGARYDVTQFGATGDGSTDDTAAIQAAFTACWNNRKPITPGGTFGGAVEFPGARSYVISSTIYTYEGCRLEGNVAVQWPSPVIWNGPAAGTVFNITSFIVASNSLPYYPAYSPPPNTAPPYTVTFPIANSVSVNNWVLIQGFSSSTGISINNTVAQVVAASGSSFTVVVPFQPASDGTIIDTGTVTTINVMFASNTHSRYYEDLRDIATKGGFRKRTPPV